MNKISTLIKETPERPLIFLPCEVREKRGPSMNLETVSHETLNLLVPWSLLPNLQNPEK